MEPALTDAQRQERRRARLDAYQSRIRDTFQLDPKVEIKLGGVTWQLEYNNRAVKGVYTDTGFNLLSDQFSTDKNLTNPELLGSLLYHGLKRHHPEMTPDQADDLFTTRHYPYVIRQIQAALDSFLPDLSDLPDPDEGLDEGGQVVQERDPTK